MPSTRIATCISSFLSCLDKDNDNVIDGSKGSGIDGGGLEEDVGIKSSIGLTSKAKSCYQLFQDCSGSVILIPDLYNGTTSTNQGNHMNEINKSGRHRP